MKQLHPDSDRVLLTVRIDRAGEREWCDEYGTTALIWRERHGERLWFARRVFDSSGFREESVHRDTEREALDWLLNPELTELRDTLRPELRGRRSRGGGQGFAWDADPRGAEAPL